MHLVIKLQEQHLKCIFIPLLRTILSLTFYHYERLNLVFIKLNRTAKFDNLTLKNYSLHHESSILRLSI